MSLLLPGGLPLLSVAAACPREAEQMCGLIFKLKSQPLANKQGRRENTCPERGSEGEARAG